MKKVCLISAFENLDPGKYSDKEKPKNKQSLREFLQPTAAHFPKELVEGWFK